MKKLLGQLSLNTKPNDYSLVVKAQMDQISYYGRVGANIEGNDRRSVWRPILEYQFPGDGKKNIKVDGQITKEVNGPVTKYTLDGVRVRKVA